MQDEITQKYINQLLGIISRYNYLGDIKRKTMNYQYKDNDLEELITRIQFAVFNIAGNHSVFGQQLIAILNDHRSMLDKITHSMGVIQALHNDLSLGYLSSHSEIIRGDLFSDYLDMAEHLLEEGYKDAAAVMAGGTLETHLKKISEKNEIEIFNQNQQPKIVSKLVDELKRREVFNKSIYKQVIAWLDIRNNAAHAKYDQYSTEQIDLLIQGLRNFINQFPA